MNGTYEINEIYNVLTTTCEFQEVQDNAPADTRSIESIVYLVIAIEVNELYTVLSWSDINPIPIDGLSDGAMIIRDKKLNSGRKRVNGAPLSE